MSAYPGQMPDLPGETPGSTTDRPVEDYRLLEDIIVPIDIAIALLILIVSKAPEGQKLLEKFGEKWLESQTKMVVALAESGSGNIIVAWAHSHLIAMMLEHAYMIRKGGAAGIVSGMNWLTGAITAAEIIGNVAVPSVLAFSGGGPAAGPAIRSLSSLLGASKK